MTIPLSVHTGGTEIPVPQNFRWPGGKRIAVIFRMAFEAWSDDHWPGISPMGNPLKPGFPDLNARGGRGARAQGPQNPKLAAKTPRPPRKAVQIKPPMNADTRR